MADLKTIALLQEKATKGPWTVTEFEGTGFKNQVMVSPTICTAYGQESEAMANADFIAAARNFDFTALCDEMESLKAENRTLRNIAVSRQDDFDKLKNALESIAANTCCGTCQEAALVAKKALGGKDE